MFELLFLGTSASAPSIKRSLPSLLVQYEEFRYLIDCGEGTQRQILSSGCGFKRLNKILFTHSHLDHILGVAGLLSTLLRWENLEAMDLYGGRDTIARIKALIYTVVLHPNHVPEFLRFHQIQPGVLFEEEDFTVHAFPVFHRGSDSFGFRFERKDRRPFLPEKAEALGIPPGPWRRDLSNGMSALLPDGRTIYPDQVMGELVKGEKLVVIGDSGEIESLYSEVEGADALVIEATYLEEEKDLARQYSHLTARMAAQLAADCNVKSLYLTHISRRYKEKDILAEAQSIFPNTIIARDLAKYTIKTGQPPESGS
ncbi:MAG: ribonuclease Z [Chloroflexi bacterium]|nr:ribonuclease Z [Chloroflexota bacterium]